MSNVYLKDNLNKIGSLAKYVASFTNDVAYIIGFTSYSSSRLN